MNIVLLAKNAAGKLKSNTTVDVWRFYRTAKIKCTDKWLPSSQHLLTVYINAAMKNVQTSSVITSVRMSNTRPAIPSVLSPVESPDASNKMFSCVN